MRRSQAYMTLNAARIPNAKNSGCRRPIGCTVRLTNWTTSSTPN